MCLVENKRVFTPVLFIAQALALMPKKKVYE